MVLDALNRVRGVTDPIVLPRPWWPDVGPISDLMPNAVVLRLLTAKAEEGLRMGGEVSYLVQLDGESNVKLHPWCGKLEPHPLRMPWAETGAATADFAWVSTNVDVISPARQCKTWNLSGIWSIPAREGTVWLKCVPPFFAHEAIVIRSLTPNAGPQLLAADGHRLLLAAMPGVDGHDASEPEQCQMARALVALQIASVQNVDELVRQGVPDFRGYQLLRPLTELVNRLAPHSQPLQQLISELPERLDVANNCGFPDTLVHGDAHSGNCRQATTPPLWFDWGDSFIGHPLFDLAASDSLPPVVQRAWLDEWAERLPKCNPTKAWAVLAPVAKLRQALIYQQFLDQIEPSEHVYHQDDPARILRELALSQECVPDN